MNKNLIFAILGTLVGIILIGSIVLRVVKPEAEATLISGASQLLGLLVTAAGVIYALGKHEQKLDTVVKQTNGINTAKEEENQRLTNIIIAAGLNPDATTEEIAIIKPPQSGRRGAHAGAPEVLL